MNLLAKRSAWNVMLLFATMCASSCSGSDNNEIEENSINSENAQLVNSKWTTTNQNHGVGDDWVTDYDETYNIYFYSSTKGMSYYEKKINDSDSSSEQQVAFFTYNVSGNTVLLEYFTTPLSDTESTTETYTFDESTMSKSGFSFTRGIIDSTDKAWLNTLHGTTGECQWYHNLKGAIWITGKGTMEDYESYSNTPWGKNERIPNYVYIEKGVTSIGAFTFANPSVTEVNLPSTLTKIGASAFLNATISNIDLSDNITTIGESAFAECTNLDNIVLPQKIEILESMTFANCKSVSLSNTPVLKRIGSMALLNCTLTSWTDSEVLEEINNSAFTNTDFNTIVLPNSLTTIEGIVFSSSNIKEIHVGTGLTTISETPFYGSSSGKLYINQNAPLTLTSDIVLSTDDSEPSGWTLYVPKGSQTAYTKTEYWKNFGSIIEDENLSGNGTEAETEEEEETTTTDYKTQDNIDAKDSRRGNVSSSFSGKGTSSSPYLISSAADLRLLSDECRSGNTFDGKYFKVTADITINNNVLNSNGEPNDNSNFERWIPIGRSGSYKEYSFYGTFDGDGHTISGIYINRPEMSYNGLFGVITDATIKNLTLKDSYISGRSAGGIVNQSIMLTSGCTITNCHNYATVIGDGGIMGYGSANISKCSNYGQIDANDGYTAGICGRMTSTTDKLSMNDCINYGSISGYFVGGIIASCSQTVKNCANYGTVSGTFKAGGICGLINSTKGIVNNCINTGKVTAETSEGAITGSITRASVTYNHYLNSSCSSATGTSDIGSVTKTSNNACSESEMQSSDILTQLNSRKSSSNSSWVSGNDGYPTLEWNI